MFPIAIIEQCWGCDRIRWNESYLKYCSGCRRATYCNKDCQKLDWNEHRKICRSTNVHPATKTRRKQIVEFAKLYQKDLTSAYKLLQLVRQLKKNDFSQSTKLEALHVFDIAWDIRNKAQVAAVIDSAILYEIKGIPDIHYDPSEFFIFYITGNSRFVLLPMEARDYQMKRIDDSGPRKEFVARFYALRLKMGLSKSNIVFDEEILNRSRRADSLVVFQYQERIIVFVYKNQDDSVTFQQEDVENPS